MSNGIEYESSQSAVGDVGQLISSAALSTDRSLSSDFIVESVLTIAGQENSAQVLSDWLPGAMRERFNLLGCQLELHDASDQSMTVSGGSGESWLDKVGQHRTLEKHRTLYEPFIRGEWCQLSAHQLGLANSAVQAMTWLGCPIMHHGHLLGVLWLLWSSQTTSEQHELEQLRPIVNGCAIALHQTDLERTLAHQQAEIQQLRRAKDEFLQLISHELFIPLGSIQLSAQTLERIFKDASWRKVPQRNTVLKVLSLLSQECRRQKQFVDNLITLMFPEYQKTSEPMLMNLADWLPSLLRTFEPRFEQESITLNVKIPQEPLTFECDVTQLERIMSELVTNAVKYTPANKTVTITANATETAVEIAIANTGVQIPPDHQLRVFEKFYRVPELDQRQYGGSGLGLALVEQLVINLEGTIELKSTKQKTTFTVKLPK